MISAPDWRMYFILVSFETSYALDWGIEFSIVILPICIGLYV